VIRTDQTKATTTQKVKKGLSNTKLEKYMGSGNAMMRKKVRMTPARTDKLRYFSNSSSSLKLSSRHTSPFVKEIVFTFE
jgi:hypothetical protein